MNGTYLMPVVTALFNQCSAEQVRAAAAELEGKAELPWTTENDERFYREMAAHLYNAGDRLDREKAEAP